MDIFPFIGSDKFCRFPVFKKRAERIINSFNIRDDNRRAICFFRVNMVMDSGVCKFFQCPESSGKDKESIAGFNHFPFSCHQIRHLDEFRNEAVRLFSGNEYFGNDSYDFPPAARAASAAIPMRPTLPPP